MTATSHAVIGTVIAAKIGNPAVAIPIAIASHLLADIIPHWDTATNRKKKTLSLFFTHSFVDVAVGLIISLFILNTFFPDTRLLYALLIIIAASLPDILTAPYLFLNWKFRPFTDFYRFSKLFDNKLDNTWGKINQFAIVGLLVILAILL